MEKLLKMAVKMLPDLIGMKGDVSVTPVVKNNSITLTGLTFRPDGSNVGPTVYAESFMHMDPERAVSEMARVIKEHISRESVDICDVFKEENLKKSLRVRLVNAERNKMMLKNIPHEIIWGDLALYLIIDLEYMGIGGSITIRNEHIDHINMDIDEMFKCAKQNSALEMESEPMHSVIEDITGIDESDIDIPVQMLIVSNKNKVYGASAILENLDKFGDDYYLIPSSVHEWLIIDSQDVEDESALNEIVMQVNFTSVAMEEILSDHAYHIVKGKIEQRKGDIKNVIHS